MPARPPVRTGGLAMAVAAYTLWGFLPLYIALLRHVPAFELVAWRVIFTLPFCLAIAMWRAQLGDIRAALRNRRLLVLLLLSSALIAFNWVVYIAAVNGGHVIAASLGYYINPLLNVALGTVFLGEKLNRARWTAVALAILGVGVLALGALETLWISLALAMSFALYGLVRKVAPVGSVPGLTIESAVLLLPSIAIATFFAGSPAGSSFGADIETSLLLAGAGTATAVPLLCFAIAARRLDLSTLGFVQFLAPTIGFILALTVFNEPLSSVQLASFVLIWVAIAVFSWDLLRGRAALAKQTPA